jgi:hypothetical protein
MNRLAIVTAVLFWVPTIGNSALAQSPLSSPVIGGAGGAEDINASPAFQASGGTEVLRHRDFVGKPCLAVGGYARPQVIDPNLYDDVITAANSCPQRIAIQVCYYQSDDCIPMDIPGGERREAILGILPSTQDFRFEFREKF